MATQQITTWITQYLNALGLSVESPTFHYLQKICTAQLTRFPFENISKLIYVRDQKMNEAIIPTNDDFISHHFSYQFGGTCFTQNSKLLLLLRHLGYSAYLAKLGDDHMAILVELPELPNERLFIDCGAAAPFFIPVRFESDPNNVSQFGSDQIFLNWVDREQGIYHFVRYRDGQKSGKDWLFNVNDRYEFADFKDIINQSNQPQTTFMTMLRCQIWQLDQKRNLSLANHMFTIRYADGSYSKQKLHSIAEIENVVATEFGLPRLPVREAIEWLRDQGIDIFAEQEQ